MENITIAEKNKMAAIYGLLLGVISMVMTTGSYMMVGNLIGFYALTGLFFILYFVLLGIFAGRIRKANGGYIEFKEVFGAVIIMVFVSCLISYLYNFIYVKYIDPGFMDKMKTTVVQYMEKNKVPDDTIDETVRKMDKQTAESKGFNFGKNLLAYFELVIFYTLFGLIVSLIVKKNKPVFDN